MQIKEFRVYLPFDVEEYRIAQLYMIARKSAEESVGDFGVEILKNEPYKGGPGPTGSGQYTKKVIHFGNKVPAWIRAILPKTAMCVEEEAWNAYPYTKTVYRIPFVEKFSITLETLYKQDLGTTANAFNLKGSALKERAVEYLDFVNDPLPKDKHEVPEEDPLVFVSKRGRGPLSKDWVQTHKTIMCAYKLCRVEFKYWGLQSKIERYITQVAMKNTMNKAHRQVWAWQDSWVDLQMKDIREMEKETAKILAAKAKQRAIDKGEPLDSYQAGHHKKSSSHLYRSNLDLLNDVEAEIALTQTELPYGTNISSDDKSMEDDSDEGEEFYDAFEKLPLNDMQAQDTLNLPPVAPSSTSNRNSYQRRKSTLSWASSDSDQGGGYSSDRKAKTETLLFVLWSGEVGVGDVDLEYETLLGTFRHVMFAHYCEDHSPVVLNRIHLPEKQVSSLSILSQICPSQSENVHSDAATLLGFFSPEFREVIEIVKTSLNEEYKAFLEGNPDFCGKISILADSVGAVACFEIFSNEPGLEFSVDKFFSVGAPIGLIVSFKRTMDPNKIYKPRCGQFYNIYHSVDPVAFRVEPLLDESFASIKPVVLPRYHQFPIGRGEDYCVYPAEAKSPLNRRGIVSHSASSLGSLARISVHMDGYSTISEDSAEIERDSRSSGDIRTNFSADWWGQKRIDFELYHPEGWEELTSKALLALVRSCYCESNDFTSFLIRELTVSPISKSLKSKDSIPPFKVKFPVEKFQRKRTAYKIKGSRPNHRGRDSVVVYGQPQVISGKFAYGPLDLAYLKMELVDVYIYTGSKWQYFDTVTTNTAGVAEYVIPEDRRLGLGSFPVKLLVKGDHSLAELTLFVVRPYTEAVVFSIDGSFAASRSLTGRAPVVQANGVELARLWSSKGFLNIYASGRPDMQQQGVVSWLAEHEFPAGLIWFADHATYDPGKHKQHFLMNLMSEAKIKIAAAYGSSKDLIAYAALGIPPERIFIVHGGKGLKNCTSLDGYKQSHLSEVDKMPFPKVLLPRARSGLLNVNRISKSVTE
eukprot:Nk52_evm4s386 gene=Nk52_evmTU4s386